MIRKFALSTKVRNLSIAAFGALGTGLALAGAPADPFTAAMADATSAVQDYAAALVGLAAVAVVFMIAMKYVKKISGAS